jgi:uncharacterized protein with FMN-binding domain
VNARAVVRRAVPAAVATAGVVVLLHSVRARPQTLPDAGQARRPPPLQAGPSTKVISGVSSKRPAVRGRVRTAAGDPQTTPFSYMQVRVTLTGRELTRVETIGLSGTGARTQAINARAEPVLREEALRAGSADIDVVTGATYTSRSYRKALQSAIDRARRG